MFDEKNIIGNNEKHWDKTPIINLEGKKRIRGNDLPCVMIDELGVIPYDRTSGIKAVDTWGGFIKDGSDKRIGSQGG
jgi:hypothetical protein